MGNLDRWIVGRRGALLAALIALAAGISGLLALPALDRNESAFVQATVQMLESGDFVAIRYQEYWRGGASPGVHWLQAAIVSLVSSPEARAIWPYRLVSLFGVMLAATATVWGGAALFGRRAGFFAGAGLSLSLLVVAAAGVATADAAFLAACAALLAGFGRAYVAACENRAPRKRDRAWFWAGLIAGVIIKGPVVLLLAGLAGAALAIADRKAPWFKTLGWGWGLIALLAFAGPWAVAVTIATDGAYWSPFSRPPAPPSLPLWQTWLSPVLLFPMSALLPAAAVLAARERATPGVRVCLAWLLPAWLVIELLPGKQVFGLLPLLVPLAWLCGAALVSDKVPRLARLSGAALGLALGLGCAGVAIWLALNFGQGLDLLAGVIAAVLFGLAGLGAAAAVLKPRSAKVLAAACVMAILAPNWLLSATAPSLDRLWPTQRILRALTANGLDPRQGLAVGPVAAAGYAEPSLVFALGASTQTGDGAVAARAIADGRPAIVEAKEEARFKQAAAALGARPKAIGRVVAYDYAAASDITLTLYRP